MLRFLFLGNIVIWFYSCISYCLNFLQWTPVTVIIRTSTLFFKWLLCVYLRRISKPCSELSLGVPFLKTELSFLKSVDQVNAQRGDTAYPNTALGRVTPLLTAPVTSQVVLFTSHCLAPVMFPGHGMFMNLGTPALPEARTQLHFSPVSSPSSLSQKARVMCSYFYSHWTRPSLLSSPPAAESDIQFCLYLCRSKLLLPCDRRSNTWHATGFCSTSSQYQAWY